MANSALAAIILGFDGGRFGKLPTLTSPVKDTLLIILCNVTKLLLDG
jgi:hypothetical protein